ncbi:unnamed protein product, partial [Acanthoscelides obtectus]
TVRQVIQDGIERGKESGRVFQIVAGKSEKNSCWLLEHSMVGTNIPSATRTQLNVIRKLNLEIKVSKSTSIKKTVSSLTGSPSIFQKKWRGAQ